MIENLIKLVKENADDLIINNEAISNEHKEAAILETGNTIISGLKSEVSKGNIAGLSAILNNNDNLINNPIVAGIISNLASILVSKFNVNSNEAELIAQGLIPKVINELISKTKDPNDDSFTVQGLLSNLGGSGFGGMLINMFGSGKKDGEKGGFGGKLKNFLS